MSVPRWSSGRCPVCERPARGEFALCYCCGVVVRQLHLPLVPLCAVAQYRVGDALHRRLRGYKDAREASVRRDHRRRLVRMLECWLAGHRSPRSSRCPDPGEVRWDTVTTVPSTRPDRPVPGLTVESLVAGVPGLARCQVPLLERGPDPADHLRAGRRVFTVAAAVDREWLAHRRILVVDDTVTTGARAQSAAAALRLAGGRVVGVVAIGRAVLDDQLLRAGTELD